MIPLLLQTLERLKPLTPEQQERRLIKEGWICDGYCKY
jgi:hypothetical protein